MKIKYAFLSYVDEKTGTIYIDTSKRLLPRVFDHAHELVHYILLKLGVPFKFHLLRDMCCPQGLLGRAKTGDILYFKQLRREAE